jgi:hypothetical protein
MKEGNAREETRRINRIRENLLRQLAFLLRPPLVVVANAVMNLDEFLVKR